MVPEQILFCFTKDSGTCIFFYEIKAFQNWNAFVMTNIVKIHFVELSNFEIKP